MHSISQKKKNNFFKLKYVLLGLVGWLVFGLIESFFCHFFTGKYWYFYVVSAIFWIILGLAISFFLLIFTVIANKIYYRFRSHNEYPLIDLKRFLTIFM